MDVSVSGTIDEKTYLKKLRGSSGPSAPPGSAYVRSRRSLDFSRSRFTLADPAELELPYAS